MKYDDFPFCKLNKINVKLILNNKTSTPSNLLENY
jgi:hypothetical protein